MFNSSGGSYKAVNSNICQTCGSVTFQHEASSPSKKKGITYVILGWLFFAISLVFMPLLFGVGAVFMGIMTFCERSQVHGAFLTFFAATGLILGSLFSFMVSGTFLI
ncbi:hypothetical protein KW850_21050 [Bacillus sp. sid0103]|uniref:hypothetical protein n=1 Tax=Bacillus sp. sid0103 TaxID=2856337 RepID=UPI001C46287C|nr:hypothetical protein [Bacillus sp. sid0103]MBV7507720.1 hypothetical protein [Bacillus sp. sid0103]